MTNTSPLAPRLVKGGIVTMDPGTSAVKNVIALQYNPDSLTRTLQIQAVQGAKDGTRVDALRLRGPAVETTKLDAGLDVADRWSCPTNSLSPCSLRLQFAQLEMHVPANLESKPQTPGRGLKP